MEDVLMKLTETYPLIEKDTLFELLLACNGSKADTIALIDESIPQRKRKERPLYQSSLSTLIKKQKVDVSSSNGSSPLNDFNDIKKVSVLEPAHVSMNRRSSRPKVIKLFHPDDIKEHLHPYVSLHRSFLPKEMADKVLEHMILKIEQLSSSDFYLFGQLCKSDHATGVFLRDANDERTNSYVYNGKESKANCYTPIMKEVSILVEKFVNEKILLQNTTLSPFGITASVESPWKGDRCVVNYYPEGASHLDWHSDRLSYMGPLSIVTALSVGATREFRVRRCYDNFKTDPDSKPIPTQVYSIMLPHNSMIIMHPGCQEEYKHCVLANNGIVERNPISGPARFSLTYRHYPATFYENLPTCKCKIVMTLRRAFKDVATRGRYFWSCERKYLDKDCGAFHWTDFNNVKNHFIYDEKDEKSRVSEWVAPDDYSKQEYRQKTEDLLENTPKKVSRYDILDLGEDDLYRVPKD